MRILIDASSLLLRSAGVKTYFYHWITHLRQQAGGDRIFAFPFLNELGELHHDRSVLCPRQTWPRLGLVYAAKFGWSPVVDLLTINTDVFHISNLVRNPPRRPLVTATIHDLTYALMPDVHTPANVQADTGYAERVLKKARRLIAVSENTRRDAVHVLGIPPDRVSVIYPGVAPVFFDVDAARVAEVRHKLGIEKDYVLFVGTIEPRKNVGGLLDAWESLADEFRDQFRLVIAGPEGWRSESVMARLEKGINGVRYAGYVPEQDLPALTAGARVLAYPSLYEGFGFPVAQAMAAGVPVITSNVSSLPEVTGPGGILIDPRSPAELASGLKSILLSPSLRERLAGAAKRQALRYQWDRCAQESLEFFREL